MTIEGSCFLIYIVGWAAKCNVAICSEIYAICFTKNAYNNSNVIAFSSIFIVYLCQMFGNRMYQFYFSYKWISFQINNALHSLSEIRKCKAEFSRNYGFDFLPWFMKSKAFTLSALCHLLIVTSLYWTQLWKKCFWSFCCSTKVAVPCSMT